MKENDIKELMSKLIALEDLTGNKMHHWRSVLEDTDTLWSKCPFKVGDLVMLNKTPEITKEKSWGWLGSKHYLIQGALATIVERQFYDGRFVFGLHFMEESWIDHDGIKHPAETKAMYMFGESWLVSADYGQLPCEAI